jgi:hypothetical protein
MYYVCLVLQRYAALQSELEDRTQQHTALASSQQQLSKRFKGFHDLALNLTHYLDSVGHSILEQKQALVESSASGEAASSGPVSCISMPQPAPSCPPADHSELYMLLEEKDKELEEFHASVSHSFKEIETEFSAAMFLKEQQHISLRQKVIELETNLATSQERSHLQEQALTYCITIDDMQQTAKDIASEIANSTAPGAPSCTLIPAHSVDETETSKVCFEDSNIMQTAIGDIVASSVMPRLTQLYADRFSELSSISEQVNIYLDIHGQNKKLLEAAAEERKFMCVPPRGDCLEEGAVKSMISDSLSRECSQLSQASLDSIQQGLSAAKTAAAPVHVQAQDKKGTHTRTLLPPDHAQLGAGGEVVYSLTSPTFSRNPKLLVQAGSADVSKIEIASIYVWDVLSQLFYVEDGIGKPEDAISHKVTLGQCWAMTVSYYIEVNLSKSIEIKYV